LLPSNYLPDVHTRLILYKRIANAPDIQTLEDLQVEMIDRFGLLPDPAKALLTIAELKLQATPLGIHKIDFGAKGGYLLFEDHTTVEPQQIVQLVQSQPRWYKFDGQQKLQLQLELPEFAARCQALEKVLAELKEVQ
jgi:transcription-repair coupling factor (superfamily II helicase)